MKPIVSVLLACLLLLVLAACGTELPVETQATTESAAQNTTTQPTGVETTTQIVEAKHPTQPAEMEYTTQVVKAEIDPNFDADALFKRLEGVWNDDYENPGFMGFFYKDGKPSLFRGVYNGDADHTSTLTGGRENAGEGTVTLYFRYPGYNDEDNNPVPERTDAMQIDLAGIDDGTLRVQDTSIWHTGEWHTLTYRCKTLAETGINAIW